MRKCHVSAFAARVAYALVGVAALVLSIGTTAADNGVETTELEWVIPADNPIWIECINEFVYGPVHITARYHVLETPAGTAHLMEQWNQTITWTGLSTGRVWLGTGVAHFNLTIAKSGEVFPIMESLLFKPLGDGPMWRTNRISFAKWDEKGDLIFDHFARGEETTCFGPDR